MTNVRAWSGQKRLRRRQASPNAVVACSRNARDWLIGPEVKVDERIGCEQSATESPHARYGGVLAQNYRDGHLEGGAGGSMQPKQLDVNSDGALFAALSADYPLCTT